MDSIFKRSHSAWQDAVAGAKQIGKENGYDLNIHKKKPSGRDFHTIVIRCAKGGPYISSAKEGVHETKRRKTSTQKTGCPFHFKLLNKAEASIWCPQRIISDNANEHNHRPLEPGAAPSFPRDVIYEGNSTYGLCPGSRLMPRQILMESQNDPNPDVNLVTGSDVNNVLMLHRRNELAGKTADAYTS